MATDLIGYVQYYRKDDDELYEVLYIAKHEKTHKDMIVYRKMSNDQVMVAQVSTWNEAIENKIITPLNMAN